jgi:hypothetical protein
MPLVTGNFSDVAERVNKQFWYDHTQNSLKVTNSGSFPIIVEVSDDIREIPAGKNYTFDEEFKTFFVRCKTKNTGSSAFSVETTSYKTNIASVEAAIANGVGGVSGILPEHAQKFQALIEADMGIKAAILGDSTESGSGARGGNYCAYGSEGDKRYPTGQERFMLNLMISSPYWLSPTKDFYEPNKGIYASYGSTFQWPTIQLLKSENPSYSFTYPHKGTKRNTMTIVYFTRTADSAVTFDLVCNGTTTTIDTYKAPVTYGSITQPQVGFDIAFAEIAIPTTDDTFTFTISNVQTLDRGNGVGDQGAGIILGFYYGKTVGFKNLAVSSTTLLNSSEANLNRGITTDDRMQAAFDYGANVFFIGWGTNDSKAGVSTVAAYKADLATRIDEIRAETPDAIIILNSDPLGAAGSQYENNASYYAAMKEVAVTKNCSYFDIMSLLATFPRANVVADDVHPNQTGYDAIGLGYSQAFGVKSYMEVFNTFVTESRIETVENKLQSNFFSELIQNSIWSNISSDKIRVLYFNAQSGTTIADKSGNSGDATLSVDAATLAPAKMGFLRTLTLGANDTWQCDDAADLSFGDGAGNDEAFSIIWFGKINLVPSGVMVGKRDMTTGAVQAEYQLFLSGGEGIQKQIALTIFSQDGTAYIGRKSVKSSDNTATEFVNDYNTYIATYDGSKACSGIKLYQNGTVIDNEDYKTGSYTGMTGGTAPLGNFRISAAGEIENNMSGTVGLVAIVKAELSAVQVAELDALIRSAYGLI